MQLPMEWEKQLPGAGLAIVSAIAPYFIHVPYILMVSGLEIGVMLSLWPFVKALYDYSKGANRSAYFISVLAIIMIGVPLLFVGREPRIRISVLAEPDNYPNGFDVGGIKWDDHFSGVRVSVYNETKEQFVKIDATIQTNMLIWQYSITSPINNCHIYPSGTFSDMTLQMQMRKDDGNEYTVSAPAANKSSVIRIYCADIIPNSGFDVVLALVNLNRTPSALSPSMILPRMQPKWSAVTLSFGTNSEHSQTATKCFSYASCYDIESERRNVLSMGSLTIP